MLRFFSVVLFLSATVFHAVAQSNPPSSQVSATVPSSHQTAEELLQQLHNLVTENNFEARFVVLQAGQDAVPYLWRHGRMGNSPDMEQLNLQNGAGKEFIRVGDHVSVFEPDAPPYTVVGNSINGPIPWALLQNEDFLHDAYEFILVGRSRISGQPAKQIRIVSLDNTRYSYQLWLDEKTGMLLKLNMLDNKGVILEQIQMLLFAISEETHPYFTTVNKDRLPRLTAMPPSMPDKHKWMVSYLPAGMKEIKQDTRRLATTGQRVEYRLFSDGLVDVSVYVEPRGESLDTDVAFRHGLSTFLSRSRGDTQVTVIGEIPPETANAIASSVTTAP